MFDLQKTSLMVVLSSCFLERTFTNSCHQLDLLIRFSFSFQRYEVITTLAVVINFIVLVWLIGEGLTKVLAVLAYQSTRALAAVAVSFHIMWAAFFSFFFYNNF